jgi:hypothetical protein
LTKRITGDLPRISEAEFTTQVIDLARHTGWLVAHFRPARTKTGWRTAVSGDGAGFPDLVLVKDETVLVVELKVPPNKVSDAQRRWLDCFAGAGVTAHVWTPADWPEIERTLKNE